jgi:two-component system, cell cycle response regulator CpdR
MPQSFTVLFVEDDTSVRDVVIRILSEKGLGVLTAADAYEAIRILAERHVDLIFTDIIMPGMDGVQLVKQAKLIRPGIKVLFTTGYAQKAVERDAMRLGKVLYKPIREPELVREVEALLAA